MGNCPSGKCPSGKSPGNCPDTELKLLTELALTSCDFSETNILQIINQDSNKAHVHMISIRMLKLCGEAICRPLNISFKTCLNTVELLSEWKKERKTMLFQFIKNMASKLLIVTVLYHSYLMR